MSSPRAQLNEHHRIALAGILRRGAHVTLGTQESRETWINGLDEMVALIGSHFTPEELDVITEGAR